MNTSLKYIYSSLVLLLILGFIFRIFQVGEPSLWIDEGFTLMQAQGIQTHGYPLLASGEKEWKDILLPYIMSPFSVNAGFFWPRLVSVVFGTLSIGMLYLMGKKIFTLRIALLASSMLTFSYWHIAWSRQIRGYSLSVFFLLACLALLFWYGKDNRRVAFVGSFFAGLLATLAKFSSILVLPFAAWYSLRKHNRWAIVIGSLCSIGLMAGFSYFTKSHIGLNYTVHSLWFYGIEYFWKTFGLVFVFALVGGFMAWKHDVKNRAEHTVLIGLFLYSVLFLSFCVYVEQKRYLFFVTPLLFLYAAFFLDYWASLYKQKVIALSVLLVLLIGIDQLTVKSFVFVPQTFFALEEYTPQPHFQQGYKALHAVLKPEDVVISAYPFMDQLYHSRVDYTFAVSYTGKAGDLSVTKHQADYYTGTPEILSITQIKKLASVSDVYVIVDDMALDRMEKKYSDFIIESAGLVWSDESDNGQSLFVYVFKKGLFDAY